MRGSKWVVAGCRLWSLSLMVAVLLLLPHAARADDATTFWAGCTGGKVWDTGLCYDRCKEGMTGVGPVCWGQCPAGFADEGALCRQPIESFTKQSYGRGAGHGPGCGGGQEQNGALCYPRCAGGYSGAGPVCWENCWSGWSDWGAVCVRGFSWHWKSSYGRGAGSVPSSCNPGEERSGLLCYPACAGGYAGAGPVCWQSCPAGFTDLGVACSQGGAVTAKPSAGRGAGTVPPLCTSRSFTNPLPAATTGDTFTLMFVSDTQFPWWTHDDRCHGSDACVLQLGEQTNAEQIEAMKAIESINGGRWPAGPGLATGAGAPIRRPQGLVLNGDLTAYWHDWQVDLLEQYYFDKARFPYPVFPGLGNHDYANNVNDCWWLRDGLLDGTNGCSRSAVRWAKAMVFCDKVPGFDMHKVQSFDNGSLAYSWNIGRWHFVQLHNRPDYEVSSIGINNSFAWLRADLEAATRAGRSSVLNFHDYGDHMPDNDPRFLAAIAGQRVVALFAGHIHSDSGLVGEIPDGRHIPVLRSGASEFQTFLLAEFADDHFNVASVSSQGGVPRFTNPGSADQLRTVWLSGIAP